MNKPNPTIIQRVLNGAATKKQAKEVADWISSDEGLSWVEADYDAEARRLTQNQKSQSPYRRIVRTSSIFIGAACLFLFAFFLGKGIPFTRTESNYELQTFETSPGQMAILAFQDGSRITLKGDTKVIYPKQFAKGERRISFSGEGLFDIATDKSNPFIAVVGDQEVHVTGTQFDLKSYENDSTISVSLIEGSVLFVNKGEKYNLEADHLLVYDKQRDAVSISSVPKIAKSASWITKNLNFSDTTLSDILKELSRVYGYSFVIDAAIDSSERFTFSTDNDSIDEILKDISMISNLRFEKEKDIVKISIK